MPASCFINFPLFVVPIIDLIEPPCAPPKVRSNLGPVIVPTLVSAIVPVPPTIDEELPKVTKPAYVAAVALLFINAPLLLIPVPLRVKPPVVVIV